jgi:hypothetical protein
VPLYRIIELDDFAFCPFTRASTRSVDAAIQDIIPSTVFRSTRNQRGSFSTIGPVLLTPSWGYSQLQ